MSIKIILEAAATRAKTFLESTLNRAGIGTLAATAATMAFQYFVGHVMPPLTDVLGLAIGVGLIVVPDNTVTVSQLEQAITDAKTALTTKSPAAIEAAVVDVAGIVKGVANAPAPAAAPVATTTTVKE